MQMKWSVIALAVAAGSTQMAFANQQAESNGFVEDSSLSLLSRNAYFNRDYKRDNVNATRDTDVEVWGQGFIGKYESGFTQGTVGFGIDAYGLLGIKLDTGKGRNGTDFFPTDSNGTPEDSYSEAGAAVKVRISNTVLKYGAQFPELPVLAHDDGRLLPQAFTGTLITSQEIEGLELNAGRFTSQNNMNQTGRDSGDLRSINVLGGSYSFSEDLSAALYFSDIEDVAKKQYANLNYTLPLAAERALNFDFNIYQTDYDKKFTNTANGLENTIWSLAAKYSMGAHAFILAYQQNTGNSGYRFDIGDGGSTMFLSNSYYSDFNNEDEKSWQASYELDFAAYGVPGLSYKTAYVRGYNINTAQDSDAKEHELFNQFKYVVQEGAAKDLSVRVRNSIYRANSAVGNDLNEVRVFVEYPLNIL